PAAATEETPVAKPPTSVPAPSVSAPPAAPAPVPGVHPPVPASALETKTPEPKAEKTSFLKKEISFGRKKDKQPKPKSERRSKQPKQSREPKRSKRRKPEGGAKRVRRLVGLKVGAAQLAAAGAGNNG